MTDVREHCKSSNRGVLSECTTKIRGVAVFSALLLLLTHTEVETGEKFDVNVGINASEGVVLKLEVPNPLNWTNAMVENSMTSLLVRSASIGLAVELDSQDPEGAGRLVEAIYEQVDIPEEILPSPDRVAKSAGDFNESFESDLSAESERADSGRAEDGIDRVTGVRSLDVESTIEGVRYLSSEGLTEDKLERSSERIPGSTDKSVEREQFDHSPE